MGNVPGGGFEPAVTGMKILDTDQLYEPGIVRCSENHTRSGLSPIGNFPSVCVFVPKSTYSKHKTLIAVRTGFEPVTSCVTGRHSDQLN